MPISWGSRQNSGDANPPKKNPFDSDSDTEVTSKPVKATSVPAASSSYATSATAKKKYGNDFREAGGFENQTVQELENYAAYKSEETTSKVNDCLKIAEDIREDAAQTLVTLHKQGEQITRTHQAAANMEQDLSKSETLLGSLGGFFSKPWKPKKGHAIKGPVDTLDSATKSKVNHLEQRKKLGIASDQPKQRQYTEPSSAMDKVQVEKAKQEDALTDLSDVLGQLKGMAVDMGTEIERQNKALDLLHDDVDELNSRVKGANQRARHLIGK